MQDTGGKLKTNSEAMLSYGLHTDVQVLTDKLDIYNSSVRTQNVVKKTCRKRWIIETNGERESRKSVLIAEHDDDSIISSIPI